MTLQTDRIDRRRLLVCAAGAAAAFRIDAQVSTRTIKMVVPYAAGGATDIAARLIAAQMARELGQQIVVENMGGAGGNLGAAAVARAAADGSTILFNATGPTAIFLASGMKLNYDPLKDLKPIAVAASFQNVVVVSATLPVRSVRDLVQYGKDHPGKLTYGTASLGSVGHLNTEMFAHASGISMVGVPYKGSSQLIVDLIAGNVQLAFDTLPAYLPHLQSGKLVALAVNGAKRSALVPGVPTLHELGFKGFENPPPFAVFAPQGLAPDAARRLQEAVTKSVLHVDVVKALHDQGMTPATGGPDDVTSVLLESIEVFRKVIRDSNIKLQ